MDLPALRYPALFPVIAPAMAIDSVVSAGGITPTPPDFGTDNVVWPHGEITDAEIIAESYGCASHEAGFEADDSVELIIPPSPEMASLLKAGAGLASQDRLSRFSEKSEFHRNIYSDDRLALSLKLAGNPGLEDEMIRAARYVASECLLALAKDFSELPEFKDYNVDIEERGQSALKRMAEVKINFVDSWDKTSPLYESGASGTYRKDHNDIWINRARGSLDAVFKTLIHELLHAAEAEFAVINEQGDELKGGWFANIIPKLLFSSERIGKLAMGTKTGADFTALVYQFGVQDVLDFSAVGKLFSKGHRQWYETLIDSLALVGLNHFIMHTPPGSSVDLVFGAERMIPNYKNFPVTEAEFEESLAVRGYPVGHAILADTRHIVSELGVDAKEAIQRLETLAYGAMFFATPEETKIGEAHSALEIHFSILLNQTIEDLGEIRFLFFMSMLAASSGDKFITRTVVDSF